MDMGVVGRALLLLLLVAGWVGRLAPRKLT